MPQITVTITDKIAVGDETVLVSDNSDYTVAFTFDDEWDDFTSKTMRVQHTQGYTDVVFSGTTASLPQIPDVPFLKIGVYAGNLHTTTPARFDVTRSVRAESGSPVSPSSSVYDQIMAQLANKVNSETGKGLSTNDYTDEEEEKVSEAYEAIHTHDNESILDTITQALVTAWTTASTWVTTNGANVLTHLSDAVVHITSAERTLWNSKLSDAPSDSKTYGRKNGAWTEVTGGSGGTTDHSELDNLDYASSGHTGFASSTDLATKMSKVTSATDGHIATFDDAGAVEDSGIGTVNADSVPVVSAIASASDTSIPNVAAVKAYHDSTKEDKAFKVTTTKGSEGYSSDKTNAEIYTAYQSGKSIWLYMSYEGQLLPAISVTSTKAEFGIVQGVNSLDDVWATLVVIENDVISAEVYDLLKSGDLSAYRTAAAQNVIDATKLEDAPSDGSEYVRKDGAWSVASGGVTDYDDLTSRPQINGVTLTGSKSLSDIGTAAALTASVNYYVSSSGSDDNAGTQAEPFATISKALSMIPRNLNSCVAAVHLLSDITITSALRANYYCNGELQITGNYTITCTASTGLWFTGCTNVLLAIAGITMNYTGSGTSTALLLNTLSNVTINTNGLTISDGGTDETSLTAIAAQYGSRVFSNKPITLTGKYASAISLNKGGEFMSAQTTTIPSTATIGITAAGGGKFFGATSNGATTKRSISSGLIIENGTLYTS